MTINEKMGIHLTGLGIPRLQDEFTCYFYFIEILGYAGMTAKWGERGRKKVLPRLL